MQKENLKIMISLLLIPLMLCASLNVSAQNPPEEKKIVKELQVKKTPDGWLLTDEAFNTLWGGYNYEKERADDAEAYSKELYENLKTCEELAKKQGEGFSENEVIVITIVAVVVGGMVTGIVIKGLE